MDTLIDKSVLSAETLWNEGNSSKSLRIDEKEKEPKREVEGGKEKERYSLKYWGKSIQELDLTNCQRCTPSYRLLPEDVSFLDVYLKIWAGMF